MFFAKRNWIQKRAIQAFIILAFFGTLQGAYADKLKSATGKTLLETIQKGIPFEGMAASGDGSRVWPAFLFLRMQDNNAFDGHIEWTSLKHVNYVEGSIRETGNFVEVEFREAKILVKGNAAVGCNYRLIASLDNSRIKLLGRWESSPKSSGPCELVSNLRMAGQQSALLKGKTIDGLLRQKAADPKRVKFGNNFNAIVHTDEMTDRTQQFLTAADKTEDKLVLTLRISTNPFKEEKNLMAHIKMVDTGNDPISSQYVALRVDKNPKADFKGTPNKAGSGISFMIKDKAFVEQMKTGKIMKAQVKRNSGYRVVDFSLAGFNEGMAWLEEGDRKQAEAAAVKKAAEPKVAKTKLPITLKAKDGSGTVDIKELAGRIRLVVRRPGDILDYKVKLHVDGKKLKEYKASKGGQEKYTGHTVIFAPMFEERDAIQKGAEMCITVRSVTRGSRAMCFDVSNIVFH